MPQSLAHVYVHLVFSTKNRHPFITEDIAKELYPYMAKVLYDECRSPAKIIGGVEDHAHILLNLARTVALADVVEKVKTRSSKWMKTKGENLRDFSWQAGYGAFSVSHSNLDQVYKYILNQREHHHGNEFKDEFRGLLIKHDMEWDERYVWD